MGDLKVKEFIESYLVGEGSPDCKMERHSAIYDICMYYMDGYITGKFEKEDVALTSKICDRVIEEFLRHFITIKEEEEYDFNPHLHSRVVQCLLDASSLTEALIYKFARGDRRTDKDFNAFIDSNNSLGWLQVFELNITYMVYANYHLDCYDTNTNENNCDTYPLFTSQLEGRFGKPVKVNN